MEQLLKIGENENVGGEVELSEFEKKLEFARLGFSMSHRLHDLFSFSVATFSIQPCKDQKKLNLKKLFQIHIFAWKRSI